MALSGTFFDATYYLTQYADVAANWSGSALAHYEGYGAAEGRVPNSWFDAQYYRANSEAAIQSMTALEAFTHYEAFGWGEGRIVSSTYANFDEQQYLDDYPDLVTGGITTSTALYHYLEYGSTAAEGRTAKNDDGSTIQGSTSTTGTTYTLTTATDSITGTANDDTIIGTNTTLTTADSISGQGGTDTLNLTMAAAANPLVTMTGVEKVNISSAVATLAGPVNTTNWTGVDTLTIKGMGVPFSDSVVGGTAGNTFLNLQNNMTLGVSNASAAADNAAVIYAGFASGKLASTTATLTLELDGVVGKTASTGVANVLVDTAGTDKFTKLAITSTGTNRVQLEGNDASEITLTDVTVTGAGSTTLSVDATNAKFTSLATFDAGTATGALTSNISVSTKDVTFTGSAGKNTITFGNGNNTITGGAAADTFSLGTGNNTVNGGAGDDKVIGTLASFTAADTIDLGAGTADALIYTNVVRLDSTGIVAANKTILNGYSNIEMVGSAANSVTHIDCSHFTQSIFSLSGTNTTVQVSNVANDTVVLSKGMVGAAGATGGLVFSGALPNQTLNIQLAGSASMTFSANATNATDNAMTVNSGISTVNMVSTTTAASTTGVVNTFAPAGGTATETIDNASAGSFNLTGDVDLTITKGVTAGFTKAVDFNASTFAGKLSIDGSTSADIITGGTKDDTIQALGGDDQISLSSGGSDTVTFGTHAGGTANGKDTITGVTGGAGTGADIFKITLLGDGNQANTNTGVYSTAAAQEAFTDDTYYIINTTGAAATLTTGGTAAITDATNLTQVAAYLTERFTVVGNTTEGVIVFNQTGTNNSYIYSLDETGNNTTIDATDLVLAGVITHDGNALTTSNITA